MGRKTEIRIFLHFQFQHGRTPTQALNEISIAKGQGYVNISTIKRWYRKFRNNENNLRDKPRSGRPPTPNVQAVLQSVENNPDLSTRKRGEALGTSKDTIHRLLCKHGYRPRVGRWIPHCLGAHHLQQRVTICQQLLHRQHETPFLARLVTVDETWVHYENGLRQINWLQQGQVARGVPKPNQLGRKVMLIVFWARFGIVHWEVIPNGTTMTGEVYRTILNRVQFVLQIHTAQRRRYGQVVLLQDNAPPHRAALTLSHIQDTLGWELLPHPAYSPDIAPSDYHLFRSMKNHLRNVQFQNVAQVENWVAQFFGTKSTTNFYQRGIEKLPGKWHDVVLNNGQYITS